MDKQKAIDLGTAIVLYQSVFQILSPKVQIILENEQVAGFEKYGDHTKTIDESLSAVAGEIEENCENFAKFILNEIYGRLADEFPIVNAPE